MFKTVNKAIKTIMTSLMASLPQRRGAWVCLFILISVGMNAQTITDELRRNQAGMGKVIINQSQEIEKLVNNTAPENKAATPAQSNKGHQAATQHPAQTSAQTSAQHPTPQQRPTTQPQQPAQPSESADAPAVNTNKKVMRRSYKTTGYRIQVFSGGNKREDRTKCENIASRLKSMFPSQPIYVHFYSPSWKCRMGNFTDHSEAEAILKQVRAMGYPQASLVKGTISVQY